MWRNGIVSLQSGREKAGDGMRMYGKYRWGLIFLLSGLMVCTGCGKNEKQETGQKKNETMSYVNRMRMQVKEEGIFYLDGYTTLMMFYDYNMGESMPICDKPNCKHNSADCNAFLQNGFQSAVANYRGKLYFIDPTSSECILYESDLNGDNRRGIAKLNEKQKHAVATLELPIYFYGDKMYIGMTYSDFLEKPVTEENGTVKNMKDTWEIIEVSLSDGTITSVKEPEEIDMTNSYVTIDEYFGDSVLFSLERDMYLYDMKNKEEKQVFSGNDPNNYIGINVEKGMLYYRKDTEQETEVFQVDINSLEEKSVIKKNRNGKDSYWILWDDQLYYSFMEKDQSTEDGEIGKYDLEEKKELKITKEEYRYIPQFESKEWYILQTEEGTECIRKSDYAKRNWDKIQTIGKF